MAAPTVTRVVAAYIEEEGRVLVQQRPPHKARGGFWELPGGKVDAGESDEAALRRELHEELSVAVEVGDELGRHEHSYDDLTVLLVVYRVRRHGVLLPTEGQPLAWQPREALLTLPLCAADSTILRGVGDGTR